MKATGGIPNKDAGLSAAAPFSPLPFQTGFAGNTRSAQQSGASGDAIHTLPDYPSHSARSVTLKQANYLIVLNAPYVLPCTIAHALYYKKRKEKMEILLKQNL